MNGNSLIKEIGRSYIVSSFIPASFFVFLLKLIFQDFIPNKVIQRLGTHQGLLDGSFAFLILFISWIAFALYSYQDRIIKFYEGYYFPWPLNRILTVVALLLLWRQEKYLHQYLKLKDEPESPIKQVSLDDLYPKVMAELQDRELQAPLKMVNLLPTRLGNVLRASEDYPYDRYGIDGITIWPRLYNFLPSELKEDLQEYNNHLAFFLNSSLLALVLAFLSIVVAGIQFTCNNPGGITANLCSTHIWQRGFLYFSMNFYWVVVIVSLLTTYVLYTFGIAAAEGYGLYVRTAYDLYRHELLNHTNRTWGKKLKDTSENWGKLGHFYIAGDFLGEIDWNGKQKRKIEKNITGYAIISGIVVGILYKIARVQKNKRAMT